GDVVNSSQYPRTGAWYGDKRTELLLIRRAAGANTIQVVNQIKAMMPSLMASIPPTVHVSLVSDRSLTIQASVEDVEFTMAITVGLVVLVIFLFLRTAWATIIPSVTVPLALVITTGVMYLIGYNLDNLSLMALTISVIFLFLRTAWATIIPSVTVPLALVITTGVMYLIGYNLDNLSLMALTISVGF